jgi:HK97 family phage major capsid protein/ATP-dependent Clp endopeptidase proteolytic subunit ClpP
MKQERKYYEIKALADEHAELWIYEQIGEGWFGEGVTAKKLVKELSALNAKTIDLHVNSPGGSVFDGVAIHNALKNHKATVTGYNDGLAASIATVVLLGCDRVVMASNALFMIHNPLGWVQGNAADMRKYADVLDKVRDTILTAYRDKTGLDDASLIELMDGETWMDAEEALGYGFVDEIGAELKAAACFDLKALGFRNAPVNKQPPETGTSPQSPANHTEAPQVAIIKEAPAMSQQAAAPAAGANKEAVEITRMCINHRVSADQATAWIEQGMTADGVGRAILDLHAAGKLSTPAAEAAAIVDMGKEGKVYSYQKALLAAIEMREGRQASGFEVEIHQEIAKKLPQNYASKGGILVPMRVGAKVDPRILNTVLTTGGTNTGAETVFQEYGEFIDLLRNMAAVTRMGARTLTDLRGPITFPKQTGASTAYWMGENPDNAVTQSNPTFGTVGMSPKTLQATGAVSRQLLVQSTPDVEGILRQDLAAVHALAWDLAALHGTGQDNQPSGIYVAADVNAKAMGGTPTFGKLVDMETEINKDNALLGNFGWLTTPGMAGKMRQTLESSTAGARWIWNGNVMDGDMIGYRAVSSNQASSTLGGGSNEHAMILGNWADLLIGMWAGLEIIVDPYTLADKGLVKMTSFQMVDIACRRGQSFAKATGATI